MAIFTGAGVAIATPFDENYKVDYDKFGELIDFQVENGSDAIIVCGTTGEASTLNHPEHINVIKYCVDRVNKRLPVIAGTGSNDTAYAVQLSQYAESVGADGLLLVTPYYNKCTQKGLVEHFTKIADSVNIPCILYNVPSRTGLSIKVSTYAELAKHPNIVAVKEANGDLSSILRLRHAVGDELTVYSGNDDQIVPILSIGGMGVISVLSNVAPKETHDICQLYFDGKVEEAAKLQIAYTDLIDALFCETNPIPAKTAMRLMGYAAGPLRLPLCEMEPENLKKLETAMKAHNLI